MIWLTNYSIIMTQLHIDFMHYYSAQICIQNLRADKAKVDLKVTAWNTNAHQCIHTNYQECINSQHTLSGYKVACTAVSTSNNQVTLKTDRCDWLTVSKTALTLLTQYCDTNTLIMPSVLWRCWLGGRKGIRPVKNRVVPEKGPLNGCVCVCVIHNYGKVYFIGPTANNDIKPNN